MSTIKVGIAGLGRLGKVHAKESLLQDSGVSLTAACSIMESELDYAKRELGVNDVYTDFHEMLGKADIDAVAIVIFFYWGFVKMLRTVNCSTHYFGEQ